MNTQDLLKALISRVSGGMVHIHIDEIMTAHQHHLAMVIQDNGYVQCKLQEGPEQPEWPADDAVVHVLNGE